jgi:hypothetical protein
MPQPELPLESTPRPASRLPPIHLKRHGDSYFHLHPSHAVFSLIASFVLAVLIVLTLVLSAR